eukprot:SAG31_NODE_2283_length_6016_cov_17.773872_1_plen_545_part_00
MPDQDPAGFEPQPESTDEHSPPSRGVGAQAEKLRSEDAREQLDSLFWLHKLLSGPKDASIGSVLAAEPPVLPRLAELLDVGNDSRVRRGAAQTLEKLSGDDGALSAILQTEPMVLPRLIEMFVSSCSDSQAAAVRLVGNCVGGTEEQTQAALDAKAVPALAKMLSSASDMKLRKESCWALSNVAGGTAAQVGQLQSADAILPVVNCLTNEAESLAVKKEALWVISNLTEYPAQQGLAAAVAAGCIPPVVALLGSNEQASAALVSIVQHSTEWAAMVAAVPGIDARLEAMGTTSETCCQQKAIIENAVHGSKVRRFQLRLPSSATDDQCLAREIAQSAIGTALRNAETKQRMAEARRHKLGLPDTATDDECLAQETAREAERRARIERRMPLVATFSTDAAISAAQRKAKVAAVKAGAEPCDHRYTQHFGGKFSCADCWAPLEEVAPDRIAFEQQKLEEAEAEDRANENHSDFLFGCGVPVEFVIAFTNAHDCWDWDTRDVQAYIIKPETEKTRGRYVDLPDVRAHADVGEADVFVSRASAVDSF